MACKYCEQFDKQKQTSLSQGSSTFKLETLRKHEVSEMHSMCQEVYVASTLPPASSPIKKGFHKAGVCKLLQEDLNHLVGIHCVGHRLELAL